MSSPFLSLLTICGIPEIETHGTRGVTHVLSILDPDTPEPPFGSYPPHRRVVLRFDDIVVPEDGKEMPRPDHVEAILGYGRAIADGAPADRHLLVHCHAGISRSTAAMTMILAQAHPELPEAEVIDRVATIRPQAWPNLRLIEFADAQLGRDGRLIEATARLYRRRLDARPELAAGLERLGRSVELDLARSLKDAPSA